MATARHRLRKIVLWISASLAVFVLAPLAGYLLLFHNPVRVIDRSTLDESLKLGLREDCRRLAATASHSEILDENRWPPSIRLLKPRRVLINEYYASVELWRSHRDWLDQFAPFSTEIRLNVYAYPRHADSEVGHDDGPTLEHDRKVAGGIYLKYEKRMHEVVASKTDLIEK